MNAKAEAEAEFTSAQNNVMNVSNVIQCHECHFFKAQRTEDETGPQHRKAPVTKSGIDILPDLRGLAPNLPVLVLSMHAEDQFALRLFRAGITGLPG